MDKAEQNLQGFIDEILEELRGLTTDAYIPDEPSLNPGVWPYGTAYTASGITHARPAGLVQTDLSDVTIAWIVPLDDMEKAMNYLLPFREMIPKVLIDRFIKRQDSDHIQHPFQEIQVVLGPIEWTGGQSMFGWLITLIGAKIQNEV